MADRGLLRGVADEGGWWPEFASNAKALDTLIEAIERADLEPGRDVSMAIDVAASQLRRGGRYHLAAEGIELESDELIELLMSAGAGAIPSCRSKIRWRKTMTRGCVHSRPGWVSESRSWGTTIS